MKVLFAIGNAQTSKSVADNYYQKYGEQLEYKDVFYFRALLEEVRKDSTYDRIVVSEELEPIKAVTIEEIDKVIFSNMDVLTDEAQNSSIAFIASDRRTRSDALMARFYNLGVYSILLGNDRSITSLCDVIKEPRTKKEAREYLDMNPATSVSSTQTLNDDEVDEAQFNNILKHYEKLGTNVEQYIPSFERIEEQYTKKQLMTIVAGICVHLPSVAEVIAKDPRYAPMFNVVMSKRTVRKPSNQQKATQKKGILNFLSSKKDSQDTRKIVEESARMQEQEEQRARLVAQKAEEESRRLREESERAAREQAEKLRKEAEERIAAEEAQLKRKEEEARMAKEAAERLEKANEELRMKALADQRAREEQVRKQAQEQEELRQRALAEQKAREEAQKRVQQNNVAEVEIDLSALQSSNGNKEKQEIQKQVQQNKSAEIEIDLSALQANSINKVEVDQKEQEELRQRALAEQKAKEEQARKQAQEQEELRRRALAEQKAKEEQAQKQAQEQEELRRRALAEQRAKEEQAQKQAQEQEELRRRALAEQKAREEAERLVKEQELLRQKIEADRVAAAAAMANVTNNIVTPTENTALISQNGDNDPLQGNFDAKAYALPSDYKKVIALVGTNKVGTTFIANAIANNASEKGIQTALLDMTKSKGLYYLYNKSDPKKIQLAAECIKNLSEGRNTPLSVDKNKRLTVYTSLPGLGENRKNFKHKTIVDTIKKTCNLLIIDCDFTTPIEYFEQASEIYIVQDMDLIKLQETTAFLREFKNRNIDWSKLNVIINKYVKSSFTPKKIVEVGLAYYNDPQMTYTEEFEIIKSYIAVPFTMEDYVRYTEDVAKDRIIYKNYSVQLRSAIDQICQKIYPIGNASGKRKGLFK
ncbi:MAG: hypothetical protein J6B87_05220 [Clostridia bacterium]|nr:hypothetical protein [Clostridia bacterium]